MSDDEDKLLDSLDEMAAIAGGNTTMAFGWMAIENPTTSRTGYVIGLDLARLPVETQTLARQLLWKLAAEVDE
jgi:hypothetical protein